MRAKQTLLGRAAPGMRLYGEPCGALLPDLQRVQMSKSCSTWLFHRSPARRHHGMYRAGV